jgi:two-component system OmpR family sensor kinase
MISARGAITLRYLAIVLPLILAFALALDVWLGNEIREELRTELEHESGIVLDRTQRELEGKDRKAAMAKIGFAIGFLEHPMRVRDGEGVLARTPPSNGASEALAETVLDEATPAAREAAARRSDVELVVKSGPAVTVEAAISRAEVRETMEEFRLAALGAFLATFLLAGGGGYLLAASALRPVDAIARAAARIDARSLDARLPGRPVNDELGRLVETLNRMLARIDDGVSAARRFTQDASHELKTPLAAIKGTVDVSLLAPRRAEEDERAFQAIAREAERLERVVRDLLTIAHADAGSLVEQRERLDARTVLDEVAEVGAVLAQERGAHLHAARGEEPLPVTGDLARLRQVGLNLVDNAIRYGRKGGNVWVTASRSGDAAVLTVDDDGPGIAAAERELVFERFHRGRHDVPGVGLGLAIARAIAQEHQGTLVAEASPRGGARFVMRLPIG